MQTDSFIPSLLKVEVSADQVNCNEIVWITCWWQNLGTVPSNIPLKMFAEMQLGHQRLPETKERFSRTYWEPYPGTNSWKQGQIIKSTCRWTANPSYGGTCKIHVGICGDDHIPVDLYCESYGFVKQVYIGDVDVGWGWGQPRIEAMRKPWAREFSPGYKESTALIAGNSEGRESADDFYTMGDALLVKLLKTAPVIKGIGNNDHFYEYDIRLPEAVIRDKSDDSIHYSTEPLMKVKYTIIEQKGDTSKYSGIVNYKNSDAADFEVSFKIIDGQLEVTLENCIEMPGIELLEVRLPYVVTAFGEDVNIVEFYGGGRLIPLKTALPVGYCHHYDIRNAYAVYNTKMLLVLEAFCLDDKVIVSIEDNTVRKTANIGLLLINRVRAFGKIESIKVESQHSVKISLVGDEYGKPSWQSAARFLRKELTAGKIDIYKRALVYKHYATQGPKPPEGRVRDDSGYGLKRLLYTRSFDEIHKDIIKISNIFDGIPQVTYIGGFQKGGFDDFPDVLEVDPRLGKIEDLKMCIAEGVKYNAIVGIHDNYDDFSAINTHTDLRPVAVDEAGRLWKGWIWAGGLSYIVSPWKYAKLGLMQERLKKTVELYGLNVSSHCDVLSAEVLRYDFDDRCPSSADKSIEGKLDVIKEYNKYGIDLTSENVMHPFVGHMGYALWTKSDRNESLFYRDRFIPLVYMVYHGYIGYAGISENKVDLLWNLVGGNGYFVEENHTEQRHINWIYLQTLPTGLLFGRVISDIVEDGEKIEVIYDECSYVKVDFSDYKYEVVVDSQLIARDYTTFVPGFKEGSWLAYSMEGGKLIYPAPKAWKDGIRIKGIALTTEGDGEEVECHIEDGSVCIEMKAGIPVRITAVHIMSGH